MPRIESLIKKARSLWPKEAQLRTEQPFRIHFPTWYHCGRCNSMKFKPCCVQSANFMYLSVSEVNGGVCRSQQKMTSMEKEIYLTDDSKGSIQ